VLSLASGHAWRALKRGGAIPLSTFQISRDWGGRVGSFDSRTRERRVARSTKGRSTFADFQVSEVHTGRTQRPNPSTCEVVKLRWELTPSVVRTGELPKRTCGLIICDSSQGI
jgi:hypothetical protein